MMKQIKIICDWNHKFEFESSTEIELYIDRIPKVDKNSDTVRFVLLIEPPEIVDLRGEAIKAYEDKLYDHLLTHDDYLLTIIENSHLFEFGTSWVPGDISLEKEFSVSTLVGGKQMVDGHLLRHKLWYSESNIKGIKTNFFLSNNYTGALKNPNRNPILKGDKLPLFSSQFYICIENVKRNNWFTEKLIDCLQTKTIPIYWGCPNIGNWFDIRGFIIVDSLEDIIGETNKLTPETYAEKLSYVETNYERSKKFVNINDRLTIKLNDILKTNYE